MIKVLAIVAILASSSFYFAMKFGFIVFDRCVFNFQIEPIVEAGKISNIREYKIVHEYIEMSFESDPQTFDADSKFKKLDSMLGEYEKNYP